jgi:hydrogenase maturation protease
MRKIAIIGLGNPLRMDDGIGIKLLDRLRKDNDLSKKDISFIDGGSGGFNLLYVLEKYSKVVLLDAVDFKSSSGDCFFYNIKDIDFITKNSNFSTHESDFSKIIDLSEKLKNKADKIFLFGVQPSDLSYGMDLSIDLKDSFDGIYKSLLCKLKEIF